MRLHREPKGPLPRWKTMLRRTLLLLCAKKVFPVGKDQCLVLQGKVSVEAAVGPNRSGGLMRFPKHWYGRTD